MTSRHSVLSYAEPSGFSRLASARVLGHGGNPKSGGNPMAGEDGRKHGLQLAEAAGHRRAARAQRVVWAVLALLVLAVLLGLFGGGGPFSATRARTPDGALELRYQRLTRAGAPATLEVRIAPALVPGARIHLELGREYARSARIQRISPEPLQVRSGPEGLGYDFAAAPGAPARIVFHLQMREFGLLRGRLALPPAHELEFLQLVYP